MIFLTIQGLIGKLQTHEERVNDIQEDIGVHTLFSIHYSKEKQDGSGYIQGGRGCGQDKGRWGRGRFGKGGRGNINRSTDRPNKANRLTGSSDSSNLRFEFDKTKVKCYNCEKICHYTKDCWNPTWRIEENTNFVVEE